MRRVRDPFAGVFGETQRAEQELADVQAQQAAAQQRRQAPLRAAQGVFNRQMPGSLGHRLGMALGLVQPNFPQSIQGTVAPPGGPRQAPDARTRSVDKSMGRASTNPLAQLVGAMGPMAGMNSKRRPRVGMNRGY